MPVQQFPDRVVLKHPKGPSTDILLYGASVISWKSGSSASPEPAERLFLSGKAALDGSKPVRGGIPVVFPCFGPPSHPSHLKLSAHGFARSSFWKLHSIVLDDEAGVSVRLTLEPTASIAAVFERPFHLAYVVTLAEHQISTDLHVKNTALSSTPPLEFQALFHNYIRVPANEVLVTPLKGVSYYDKVEATELRNTPKVEQRDDVDVKKFTDSVYVDAPGVYDVRWTGGHIQVRTKNFKDVVVWNPQAERGPTIGDLEDGGWEKYVCVEPGHARGFVSLEGGKTWVGQQVISVVN